MALFRKSGKDKAGSGGTAAAGAPVKKGLGSIDVKDLKNIRLGVRPRGKMPDKTSINLIIKDENEITPQKAIPAIALIVILAVLFSKFLVADRLIAMSRASARVAEMQSELDTAYATINSMSDIEDTYAHYTTSGMTEEELSLVDRVAVMKLVEDALTNGDVSRSWSLSGNVMVLNVSGTSLAELNQLAQELETKPIVERCVINTANKSGSVESSRDVAVSFIIYLQQAQTVNITEEQEQLADDAAAAEGAPEQAEAGEE